MRQVAKDSGRPVWFLLTDRSYDPAALAPPDGRRARRPRRQPAALRPGRGTPGRADPRPRHLAQSLRAARGLRRARQAAAGRDAGAAARPRDAPPRSCRRRPRPGCSRCCRRCRARSRRAGTACTCWASSRTTSRRRSAASPPWRERDGVDPAEFCYDYLVGGDGSRMLYFPVTNYVHGDLEVVRELIERPAYHARPVGWRRALRRDLRCLAQHLDADPLGARPHARAAHAAGARRSSA